MWGNVLPDSQPPQAGYSTHNNPQSNTGTQDWIDLHKKQGESDRKQL